MRWENIVACYATIAGGVVDVVARFTSADYFPRDEITCCCVSESACAAVGQSTGPSMSLE